MKSELWQAPAGYFNTALRGIPPRTSVEAAHRTIDLWSRALGLSRRTFTRLFRQETGLTFSAWQRRACLLSAVPRLLGGEAVTTIAFDLDYSSPAAFTTMFERMLGAPPRFYLRERPEAEG